MNRLLCRLVIAIVLAELALVLVSWLLSATMTGGVHSVLSPEGVRWFFGQYVNVMLSPLLVWMVMAAMAVGVVGQSRMLSHARPVDRRRHRFALRVSLSLLVILVVAVGWLTLTPHAVLLSASGHLFPSPFSRAIVPILSFVAIAVSAVYGMLARTVSSLGGVVNAMSEGVALAAPFIVLYVVAMHLYATVVYVFL